MKLYLKSIHRKGVWKWKSGTSERCKNKIHWDVNASLIERVGGGGGGGRISDRN